MTLLTKLGLQHLTWLQDRDGQAVHNWDVSFREVLCCNDEYTLHHMPTPEIEVMHGGAEPLPAVRLQSDVFLEVLRLAAVADLHNLLSTFKTTRP